jgi:hypothetical protein
MKKLIIVSKKKKIHPRQNTKKQNKKIYDLSKLKHYKIFFSDARKPFVVLSEEASFVSRWVLRPYKERGYKIRYVRLLNKNKEKTLYRHIITNKKVIIRIRIIKLKHPTIDIKDIDIPYIVY